ncbi:hypothetical protein V6N11_060127 [Hibiscus sabdariffa]|uniref:Uncharacterized protein n=1 Tax=Hibiscus sabdariffa TaxID=183260 RepID=A0ABR2P327_9ROSI
MAQIQKEKKELKETLEQKIQHLEGEGRGRRRKPLIRGGVEEVVGFDIYNSLGESQEYADERILPYVRNEVADKPSTSMGDALEAKIRNLP